MVSRSGPQFRRPWDIAQKISKHLRGYLRRLLSNFRPVGEVPAEKTVTEQNKQTNGKLRIRPMLRM